ncbi:MAG: hypothetical protein KF770_31550 [Anaerolineae bacterium]|nr:hypothetical protein [Anaerolineae bacterium]
MQLFQVSLPNFNQLSQADQDQIIGNMNSLFHGPIQHCRFITFVTPANLSYLERERRRLALSVPDEWRRRGLMEEVRIIDQVGRQEEMHHAQHYLIDFDDTVSVSDLAYWRIRANRRDKLKLPIDGDYAEAPDHMLPILEAAAGRTEVDNTRYKYAIIASYALRGGWDWRHPLVQFIVEATGPMIICVDARKIHPERVAASVEFWEGMHLNGYDRTAHRRREESLAAQEHLRDESLFHVRVLFMLLDKNTKNLLQRVKSLRRICTQSMSMDALRGYQGAAAALFGPNRNPAGMPAGHYNASSTILAACTGLWAVGREQETDGVYMGISQGEVAKHFHFLNWKGNDPFHAMILGLTGRGKTVFAQALAGRLVEQGIQTVFLEPQGHSRRLLQLVDGRHVAYNHISYDTTRINILDVVYENKSEQLDHVITLLGLLLDPLGRQPRLFANAEIAGLRQALLLTYDQYLWAEELLADHTLTPTLETLCSKLHQVACQGETALWTLPGTDRVSAAPITGRHVAGAAGALAEEIASLYVFGDYADVFNVPSNTDLTLREDMVLFDFKQVPEARRGLFYYAILAGINLQVRRHPRKRAIIVDEIHYMAHNSRLMQFLAGMVKTVRTYGAAVIMIDQDLEAFIGVEGAQAESMATGLDVAAGQFIINNIAWLISFGLKRQAALRLMAHYPDEILPSHVQFLAKMGSDKETGKGMAVMRAGGKADMIYAKLRPTEERILFGS